MSMNQEVLSRAVGMKPLQAHPAPGVRPEHLGAIGELTRAGYHERRREGFLSAVAASTGQQRAVAASPIVNAGPLSPTEATVAFNAHIDSTFQSAWDSLPIRVAWPRIARVKLPEDFGMPQGDPNMVYPREVIMGFSPFNGRGHELVTERHARDLSRHEITIRLREYVDTLKVRRQEYDTDVRGTLRKVYRDLARTEMKNPDVLLAGLLRDGTTSPAYDANLTAKNFFDVNRPCSPEGAVSDVYTNYYTGRPLTETNLAFVCEEMMSRKGPDGLVLGLGEAFQLVIPPSLLQAAVIATQVKNIVFGGSNAAPGQPAGTASFAENPMASILKYVKDIIVLPELQNGVAANNTTWYVQDVSAGPWAMCYALGKTPEIVSLTSPENHAVFFGQAYYYGWYKAEGVAYGQPQWITRCDA